MANDRSEERLRTQRRLAREYRRRGYNVIEQPRGADLPPFLRRFLPGLIVMKEDDRAVVDIRTAEDLRGSNEIKELAAAVDANTGWRLEMISLGVDRSVTYTGPSQASLERLLTAALSAYDAGQRDLSLIYLVSVMDELVHDAAIQHRVRGRERSTPSVIQELAFRGIIDGTTADVLDHAWKLRNAIVHDRSELDCPRRDEIVQIVEACRDIQAAMRLQPA